MYIIKIGILYDVGFLTDTLSICMCLRITQALCIVSVGIEDTNYSVC